MKVNDDLYAKLVKVAESGSRMTRFEMVSWCIGYYKKVDEEMWEAINKLYLDNFIDS